MTIKEMEEQTGISRTNIRFYEGEGLIRPLRRENGYRDYSEADVRILKKVKLLRSMDISLDQVKAVVFGERELKEILTELDNELDNRQKHQERTRQALRKMQKEGADFDNLESGDFLAMMENGALLDDAPPKLNLPWRRYWARCLDFSLYNMLVGFLMYDFQHRTVLVPILTLLAMLTIEPLLLSMFGTTVGKAVFGIRVTDFEGGRLSYTSAIERTWTVMWEGEALRIPIISLYFLYKSLDLCEQDIPLSWENESELTYKDDEIWRYGLFFAVGVAETVLIFTAATFMGG